MKQTCLLRDRQMEAPLITVPTLLSVAGIGLNSDRIPDDTTILAFQHLLEKNELGQRIFETVKAHLNQRAMPMKQASIMVLKCVFFALCSISLQTSQPKWRSRIVSCHLILAILLLKDLLPL